MKFSPAQREVLSVLDGRLSPVEFNGTYARTLKALATAGMVNVRKTHKVIRIRGPYDRSRVVFVVTLTDAGWRYIYNGGLDK